MARPQIHGRVIGSFSGFFYEEDRAIMDALERRHREAGGSKSDMVKECIKEACKAWMRND